MSETGIVVLLDVDNTLLDNDLVRARLEEVLAGALGSQHAGRFWDIYEEVREETDFVNFPETVERFGRECADTGCVSAVSSVLYEFPFREVVFSQSLDAIRHVAGFATPVILSDGDQLFQRYKIRAAGLEAAVGGNVLVYVHKEHEIADIRRRYPAAQYAMVDDKPRIHAALKGQMGDGVTTVMVCQGKYAHDPSHHDFPEADITIEGIGGLLELSEEDLRARAAG